MNVTLYLLRHRTKFAKEILRKHLLFDERRMRPPRTDGVEWRFFVRAGEDSDVAWFEHVGPLLSEDDSEPVQTKTAGAVLLVRAHDRLFAVTFGTGFHALDHSIIEPDFGLRVAANCVDRDSIQLAEARGLGKGKRNALSRLPRPGEMVALGLLTDEEWIRRFGGAVTVTGFAKSVSGADSLQLNIENFSLFDLPEKLRQVLDLYSSTDYRNRFPFLDYFRRESDKAKILELDQLLTSEMRSRSSEIGFAAPDEFDIAADIYRLSRSRQRAVLSELRSEDVYHGIDEISGWGSPLQSVKIDALDVDGNIVSERVPLQSYVVGSVTYGADNGDHQHYATTAGAWFRIDQQYVDLVDRHLRDNVADLTLRLNLPVWDAEYLKSLDLKGKYAEQRYNCWVSRERNFALLDRDLYRRNPRSVRPNEDRGL